MKSLNIFLKTPLRAQRLHQLAGVVCASALLALVLVPRDARCRSFDKDRSDDPTATQEFQLELVSVTRDGVPVESVQWPALYEKASVNFTHECDEEITSVTLLTNDILQIGTLIVPKLALAPEKSKTESDAGDSHESD